MSAQPIAPDSDKTEAERAFLQARVALFWKVMFFIILGSSALGAYGAVAKPGIDLVVTLALTAEAGFFWWLCLHRRRSIRFLRLVESGGLLLNLSGGAVLGRYLLVGFTRDHALATAEGTLMADAYLSMLQLGGTIMMVAIRAALVPSPPIRTLVTTAVIGAPMLVASAIIVPNAHGDLGWRSLTSEAHPWLPLTMVMMWGFAIVTCTVVSWVVYGLRVEVRHARRLGQYILEHKIGEGGMGQVYRARHGMMRRPSALKLLREGQVGAENIQRFEREVQLTARLSHPNTITLFDYGRTDDGVVYYAMELLHGANLQRIVMLDGAQGAGRVVRILTMICGALAEAHSLGLIHRDIKPANIMLCLQGGEHDVVKLLDFGLVKQLEVDRESPLATGSHTVAGTPQYMAPEAILNPDSVDARTDIYALGAVAYYLLTGTDVFDGKSTMQLCLQHVQDPPQAPSARGVSVPPALEAIVLACLEKDPRRRPQSAVDLRRRLENCEVDDWNPDRARAWWLTHQAALDDASSTYAAEPRTIAIDNASRS